jgi:hypothetical protein
VRKEVDYEIQAIDLELMRRLQGSKHIAAASADRFEPPPILHMSLLTTQQTLRGADSSAAERAIGSLQFCHEYPHFQAR